MTSRLSGASLLFAGARTASHRRRIIRSGACQRSSDICEEQSYWAEKQRIRALFRSHRGLAILLAIAVLWTKALMPAGYMIGTSTSSEITIQLCEGGSRTLLLPGKSDHSGQQAKADCPYAGAAIQGLTGAEPLLLALALAFIIALGFAPVRHVARKARSRLRPPLRGPPCLL